MPVSTIPGAGITTSTTLTTPIVATTMGVGGATPSNSGSGVTFPASQSASTDANTLDDYEEGTWTIVIEGGSTAGTTTYLDRAAWYVKVGSLVTVGFYASWSTVTGTGYLKISGLPFASGSGSNYVTGSLMTSSIDWLTNQTMATIYKPPGSTEFQIYTSGDNLAWAQQTINSNGSVLGGCTYRV
jgi:hypothetical protein